MDVLYGEDKFPDGKFKGKTVKEVFTLDKGYVKRFNSTIGGKRGGESSFKANCFISDEAIMQLQKDEVNRRLSTRSPRRAI